MTCVAVQLTGHGTGGIAVVLVAGGGAGEALAKIGAKAPAIGKMRRCRLVDGDGRALDDGLIVRPAEDQFELHLHGGMAVVDAVLQALRKAGAELLDAATAQQRGILGRGVKAEIAGSLPHAQTTTAVNLLTHQKNRGLHAWARTWNQWLEGRETGELWTFHSAAQWLLVRSRALRHLLEPSRVALIGRPNAGKSTLANALLGRPMSITSNIAGTTRDWVGALAILQAGDEAAGGVSVPVWLVDTAGIRETVDALERESIARARAQAHAADVVVWVADATSDESPINAPAGAIICWNKADVAQPPGPGLAVSALHRAGLNDLMAAILQRLDLRDINEQEPFAFTWRQAGCLRQLAICDDATACQRLLEELLTGNPRG